MLQPQLEKNAAAGLRLPDALEDVIKHKKRRTWQSCKTITNKKYMHYC